MKTSKTLNCHLVKEEEQRIEEHTKVSIDAYDKGVIQGKSEAKEKFLEIISKVESDLIHMHTTLLTGKVKCSDKKRCFARKKLEELKSEVQKI